MDVDTYIISADSPEEQKLLYEELKRLYGKSLPFVSDPELEIIDPIGMRNGDIAYRGYALMDENGNTIFQKRNDHWGIELDETIKLIEEEYNSIE
ncbi:hypothetical protein [Salirhabdus sp. Marseille-P4669]|uniref:hypothetical protein n=1 Tax=Salirhabdus sp. Marseille-P4669 TaxID=2042310 RepID=UPI001F481A8A|nr:hypothetical protein [Salirhabdus sp. Marseille-P4669]